MLSPSVQNKKIIFLAPYPFDSAPGQRFRYEQYLDLLKREGFEIEIASFLSASTYTILYAQGKGLQKIIGIMIGFFKRFALLPRIRRSDFVFIFREASPIGPPIFEWIISKLLRKKIIYDFDDAIWLTDNIQEKSVERWIRSRSKVSSICRWSYKVSCGNDYLCSYAKQFNNSVVHNPTTIDTEFLHNPRRYKKTETNSLVIGWTGSHSTLKYLKNIEPALQRIENKFPVKFIVIANKKPDLNLRSLEFIPWKKETEAFDLMKIDIGVMPLPDDEWTKGKCGFKALQYMAMEVPAIASPVGVNTLIITQGKNGFLADSNEAWYNYLSQLIENPELRKKIGEAGRQEVIKRYSVLANASNFLALFT